MGHNFFSTGSLCIWVTYYYDCYIIMTGGIIGISLLSIFISGIVVSLLGNFSTTALFEFC